ncbi:MAG: peptidylprolyl isomerase [Ignavibacteriaceae bacterium]
MAMMAKMRSLAPAFILTVGGLFVLFMVVSSSNVMEALGVRTNNVGSVNGEKISYNDFAKAVDQQLEIQKKQSGKDVDQDNMDEFRDQVWQSLVNETLVAQQVKKYDITVSNQEIRDIILGDNPPEFLKQNFIDSTGKFNRAMYENALFDPRNKDILIQAEEYVRQTRLREKLQSMLSASITISDGEILRTFIDKNTKIDAKYALVSLTQFPDSIFKISDSDLKEYYNDHLDKYEIKPQRKLKYVLFSNEPTIKDTERVKQELLNVKKKIDDGTLKFKEAVNLYSSVPYAIDTLSISKFSSNAAELIYKSNSGVVGPVLTNEGYSLYKIDGTIATNQTMVDASHILINQYGSDQKNYEEAMKLYKALKEGADFSKLAKEKSGDRGSAAKGGDLGWFGKGAMVPEFERAAFNGAVGVVQKPIKTNYGYHIIRVNGRTNKEFIVEKLVEPVKISPTAVDANYNAAQDFSYIAKKNDFDSEAKLMNYKIRETPDFYISSVIIPGIGMSKALVDFAFDNDLNSISDAYKVKEGYIVAEVSQVIKEGVRSFDEVKNQIRPLVLSRMKYEKALETAKNIKAKINGNLNEAASIDPKAIIDTTGWFSAAGPVPKVGRDFGFLEEAKMLKLNTVSEPVKGNRGYYLINVSYRTPFDSSAFAIQKNSIRNQLMDQRRRSFFNDWIAELRKNADIVDKRYLFYNR